MKRILKTVITITLSLALMAGLAPIAVSSAKKSTPVKVKKFKITNESDVEDVGINDKQTIKYKLDLTGGTAKERSKVKKSVKFKSSKSKVIKFADSKKGTFEVLTYGVANLSVIIKVNGKDVKKSVKVTVAPEGDFAYDNYYFTLEDTIGNSFSFGKNDSLDSIKQPFKFTGGIKTEDFSFSTDDRSVVAVNSKTGELTIVGEGEATITAKWREGSSYYIETTISVLTQEDLKDVLDSGLEDPNEDQGDDDDEDNQTTPVDDSSAPADDDSDDAGDE